MKIRARDKLNYLYKYTPMETAFKILENATFRYSTPKSFNDPFDIQTEIVFPFILEELPNLIVKRMDELITTDLKLEVDTQDSWGKIIIFLRNQNINNNYNIKRLSDLVAPFLFLMVDIIENLRLGYNNKWSDELKRVKLFCVTESYDNILLWSHYANFHTGVCFKIKVIPEKDNPICAAQKVQYHPEPPTLFSTKQWVDSVLLNNEVPLLDFYLEYPLIKSEIWGYEKEWRVWAPFEDDTEYYDMPIVHNEIEAIYLGVNADLKKSKDLIKIAKRKGINIFYQSFKQESRYSLKFARI